MSSPYTYDNGNPAGFVNPRQSDRPPKENKMKWTAENDAKLYKYFMERTIAPFEWEIIQQEFPEKPTIKAIQERVVKLRARTAELLKTKGIHPREDDDEVVEEEGDAVSDSTTASTPTKTAKGSKKRKRPPPTLSGNDASDTETAFVAAASAGLMPPPTKKPRIETSVQGAAPEAWMTADSLKNLEAVQAAVQTYLEAKARELAEKRRRDEATVTAAASESGQDDAVAEQGVREEAGMGVGGSGMEGGAAAAGETARTANDASGAGTGGDGASAGGDGEAEIDRDVRQAAESLVSMMGGSRTF